MKNLKIIVDEEMALANRLKQSMKKVGGVCEIFELDNFTVNNSTVLYKEIVFDGFGDNDVLFMRYDDFSERSCDWLHRLSDFAKVNKVDVINEDAWLTFPILIDKYEQYLLFRKNGVECLRSYPGNDPGNVVVDKLPLLAKKRLGYFGKDSMMIRNVSELDRYLSEREIKEYMLQSLHEIVRDVRIIVVRGDVIGGVIREVMRHDDGHIGVKVTEEIKLLEREKKLAIDAMGALSLDFGGVDVLTNNLGDSWVCEVNISPQFDAFERVTGIDVVNELVERLIV